MKSYFGKERNMVARVTQCEEKIHFGLSETSQDGSKGGNIDRVHFIDIELIEDLRISEWKRIK
jgi:hypothetical protein